MIQRDAFLEYNRANNEILDKDEISLQVNPCDELKSFISYYNFVFPTDDVFPERYTLMPSASGTICYSVVKDHIHGELWGGYTKAIQLGSEPNNFDLLILIELRPHSIYTLTGVSSSKFKDMRLPLHLIDESLNRRMTECIEECTNIKDLLSSLDAVFTSIINAKQPVSMVTEGVRLVINSNGRISVSQMAQMLNTSERHLNRTFNKHIGMSVKLFCRITRINYAIKQLQSSNGNLADIAYLAGYSDQSHFIHDFKEFCNTLPSYYLQNMSDFYNEIERF